MPSTTHPAEGTLLVDRVLLDPKGRLVRVDGTELVACEYIVADGRGKRQAPIAYHRRPSDHTHAASAARETEKKRAA